MNKHLIIFLKPPVLGKVKTRLARAIGEAKALNIYKALLKHTAKITQEIDDIAIRLYFHEEIPLSDYWNEKNIERFIQVDGDLGLKMFSAFNDSFIQNAEKVIIIGTDCPGISSLHIKKAFDLLESNDAVIGPANDGGYYLLGLTNCHPELFTGIEWSTSTVLEKTIASFNLLELTYEMLEELTDIDDINDLKAFPDYYKLINN